MRLLDTTQQWVKAENTYSSNRVEGDPIGASGGQQTKLGHFVHAHRQDEQVAEYVHDLRGQQTHRVVFVWELSERCTINALEQSIDSPW